MLAPVSTPATRICQSQGTYRTGAHPPGMPSSVTTFLLRPGQFFDRRAGRLDGVEGGVLAAGLSVALTMVLAVTLWLFAQQFTGTTTVDNPAYPGEMFCDDGGTVGGMTVGGCDEPPTVTRELSALLWEEVVGLLPWLFVGLLIVWLGLAVALHVGALVGGGTGRFGETLAVAAWGLVPTLVVSAVAGAALVGFAARTDLAASSPEALLAEVRRLQSGVSGLTFLLLQVGAAVWQAFVWAEGLRVVHGLSRVAAGATAVLVAAVPVVLG